MKFLDPRFEGHNLMPIHVMSYDSFELGARDALSFLFKDMDTGKKYVQTIEKPTYEVYVLKPEYREKIHLMEAWMEKEYCDAYVISYHWRDKELAEILGCEPKDVKYSPWIYGYDIDIEHYYWIQFMVEYGNDLPKTVSSGLFDIESDTIQHSTKMAQPGACPTSAITFIDVDALHVYTFVYTKDALPIYAETHPRFQEIEQIRYNFNQQVEDFRNGLPDFIKELHERFDDVYGRLEYSIMLFDDEIRLHQAFWHIARSSNIDFLMAWNLPYDCRNLIERPLVLGYEPESIICDPDFKYKVCYFEEDNNIQPHKRNHTCVMSVKFLPLCQMWMYAGLRVAEGKQSLKLTVVAKKEFNDEKLDYSEEGTIHTFRYRNFRKYILYNIKDVLLQLGILRKTDDISNIYERCYDFTIPLPQAFVSTGLLTYALTRYFGDEGYSLGTNANRILPPFDYQQYMPKDADGMRDIEEMLAEASMYDPDDVFEPDDDGGYEDDASYGDD